MVKVICDRCGSDIKTKEIGYISCNCKDGIHGDLKHDNEFEAWDFCKECMDEIKEFVRYDRNNSGEKTTKEPEQIDIGKIVALKKAGWSVRDIAEEMGMKQHSVSNALCRYKAKLKQMKGTEDGGNN